MPELPEVEVVRAGLAPAVTGARLAGVTVLDDRALTRHPGDAASFESALTGRSVTGAARRGKFLWLPLDGGEEAVVAHLGMSGQMLLRPPGAPAERHERVRIDLEHPEHGELAVVFADQRTFGSLALDRLEPTPDHAPGGWGTDAATVPSQVSHIARDPLDPAFRDDLFRAALGRKASAVKRVLLDQTVLSGVGNIYAAGDIVPGLQLAHRGFAQGIFVAEQIAGLNPTPIVESGIPRVTYCEPEVASVGLTEAKAKELHGADGVETLEYNLAGNGKSKILGTTGFVKLVRQKDGPVVGVHMVGARVGELIGEGQLIVNWEAYPEDVAALVHAHPTQNEALGEAHLALAGKPLHAHN